MADTSVAITAGAGTDIDTRTEATNGNHRQVIVVGDPSTNAGVAPVDGTAGLKVDLGADNDVSAAQSGTWNITNVSGTVSLPTGAATAAKQPALGTAGTPSSDVISVQGIASMTALVVDGSAVTQPVSGTLTGVTTVSTVTNLSQLGGTAVAMNTGTRSAGTQRVTIATDDVVPASQSGTWTVQPGNTANTTPWLTSLRPSASGGHTTFHLVSAASTNATNIKASAGQVYGWYIYNSNASARKVAFHNASGTPTAGASVYFSLVIPATSAANVAFPNGMAFSTGIAITTVTGLADSDATAVGANDLVINIWYT